MSQPVETGVVLPTRQPAETEQQPVESIRSWAKANGYKVADTGRMPRVVHTAYAKAHGTVPAGA